MKEKFFDNYLNELNEYAKFVEKIMKGRLTKDEKKEVEELVYYLTVKFDRFCKIMNELGVYFPDDTDRMLNLTHLGNVISVSSYYKNGYLYSDYFRRLNINRHRYKRLLRKQFWNMFNPFFWIKNTVLFILRVPYNLIYLMGFNPEEFIKTPIGQALAVILVIVFLILIGFSVDQIAEIIKGLE